LLNYYSVRHPAHALSGHITVGPGDGAARLVTSCGRMAACRSLTLAVYWEVMLMTGSLHVQVAAWFQAELRVGEGIHCLWKKGWCL
jgi:hypothetical protein